MFSTTDGSWLISLAYAIYHLFFLRICRPLVFILRLIYRTVWSRFSLFFPPPLLIRTGSWFWPEGDPSLLSLDRKLISRAASSCLVPLKSTTKNWLSSAFLNIQNETHGYFRLYGFVPSLHTQPVWLITSLMTWCFGWLRSQTSLGEAFFCIFSTPKDLINSCWLKEGMSGWQRTSQSYVKGANSIVF